jgi:hypothetical protein
MRAPQPCLQGLGYSKVPVTPKQRCHAAARYTGTAGSCTASRKAASSLTAGSQIFTGTTQPQPEDHSLYMHVRGSATGHRLDTVPGLQTCTVHTGCRKQQNAADAHAEPTPPKGPHNNDPPMICTRNSVQDMETYTGYTLQTTTPGRQVPAEVQ